MALRYEAGDLEQAGRVAIYRGPLLLCSDERFTVAPAPKVDLRRLGEAERVPIDAAIQRAAGDFPPWLVLDLPAADGKTLRVVDFASAGATGRGYESWLPASAARPARPVTWQPADGAKIGPGAIRITWRAPAAVDWRDRRHTVVISDSPSFEQTILRYGDGAGTGLTIPAEVAKKLEPGKTYYWKLIACNQYGQSESIKPYKHFTIDPSVPAMALGPMGERLSDSLITAARLAGDAKPQYGTLEDARGWRAAAGPDGAPGGAIELDGKTGMIKYALAAFPSQEYTAALWVSVTKMPEGQYGQIFSAWCRSEDDPLRLTVAGGKLFARIESGGSHQTESLPVQVGRWFHVAAVKRGEKLTLYVDGKARASVAVPQAVWSPAEDFALGGNPHYGGPEFLAARLADLHFYGRALSANELKQLYQSSRPKGDR
jgi:hypothetical protein